MTPAPLGPTSLPASAPLHDSQQAALSVTRQLQFSTPQPQVPGTAPARPRVPVAP